VYVASTSAWIQVCPDSAAVSPQRTAWWEGSSTHRRTRVGVVIMLLVSCSGFLLWTISISHIAAVITAEPQRFRINISVDAIADLNSRLATSKYPTMPARVGLANELGLEVEDLKEVVDYWKDDFDWKVKEAELNTFDQYTIEIDSMKLHYIHVRASASSTYQKKTNETVPALLFVHGWPSTAFDFIKVIPLLTDPDANGLNGNTAFDVIIPSMIGYPLSGSPVTAYFGHRDIAKLYGKLVRVLGYDTYIAAGGDWGSIIVPEMALYEETLGVENRLLGIHINGVLALPDFHRKLYLLAKFALSMAFPTFFFDEYERLKLKFVRNTLFFEMAYMLEQVTKPLTLGSALHNSPTSLAAWLVEKYVGWTDSSTSSGSMHGKRAKVSKSGSSDVRAQLNMSTHRLENSLDLEDIVTTLSLYWFTDTITTSVMLYHNCLYNNPLQLFKDLAWKKIRYTPVAIADYPMEVLWAPMSWVKDRYHNVVQYSRFSKGGHFPALEVPDSVAADIQLFAAKLKTAEGVFWKRPPSADYAAAAAEKEQGEKASADDEL
jgi:microsomal epoxide hydrolase